MRTWNLLRGKMTDLILVLLMWHRDTPFEVPGDAARLGGSLEPSVCCLDGVLAPRSISRGLVDAGCAPTDLNNGRSSAQERKPSVGLDWFLPGTKVTLLWNRYTYLALGMDQLNWVEQFPTFFALVTACGVVAASLGGAGALHESVSQEPLARVAVELKTKSHRNSVCSCKLETTFIYCRIGINLLYCVIWKPVVLL